MAMKRMTTTLFMVAVALAAAGCGKSKDKEAGGGDKGGASCADAVANYVALEMGQKLEGKLQRLKPTPDQLKALTAQLVALCTDGTGSPSDNDKGWKASIRTCVASAKQPANLGDKDPVDTCLGRDYWMNPAQLIHNFVEAETAKAAATPPPPAVDPAAPPAPPAPPATTN